MNPIVLIQLLSAGFLLPLTIGLAVWRRHSHVQRWLTLFLIGVGVLTLVQIGAVYAWRNNRPFLHLAPPMEMLFFCFILAASLKPKSWARVIPVLGVLFTLFCILSIFLFQSLQTIPTVTRTLQATLITLLILCWYLHVLKTAHVKKIGRSAYFWFSVGGLFYYPCNEFFFFYYNSLQKMDHESVLKIQMIHSVLQLILYVFYSIALLCKETPSTYSRPSSLEP